MKENWDHKFSREVAGYPAPWLHDLGKVFPTVGRIDNVYGDREIDQYMVENSLMQLLESNRIKDVIRNFESDMWNY